VSDRAAPDPGGTCKAASLREVRAAAAINIRIGGD